MPLKTLPAPALNVPREVAHVAWNAARAMPALLSMLSEPARGAYNVARACPRCLVPGFGCCCDRTNRTKEDEN